LTDKEIYELLVADDDYGNVFMEDDDGKKFEMEQIGIIPMHGVIYAVLDLLKVDDVEISEDDGGIVMLELDYDEESDEYYVSTVEDDEIFEEVMFEFEKIPEEK